MNDQIPQALIEAIRTETEYRRYREAELVADLERAEVTTYGQLVAEHAVDRHSHDIAADAVVVILSGWIADDGNAEVAYPDADDGAEAAAEYVETGEWGDRARTDWVTVTAWRRAWALDEDGELVTLILDCDRHTKEIEPDEPDCEDGQDHDWQTPHEVLGGLEENPGVWGHGSGVVMREVCAHCGRYRETDTWAQNRETGEQGLTSIEYRDADERSREWVDSLDDE